MSTPRRSVTGGGLKYCLSVHLGGQSLEALEHQIAAKVLFFSRGQFRVAQGVGYGDRGHNAVGPDAQGNGNNGAHVDHGHISGLFNGLGERCAATRAGASRGGEDYAIHMCGLEL